MKKVVLFFCCVFLSSVFATDIAERIPARELRLLLKEHKNTATAAEEAIMMMGETERAKFIALYRSDRDAARIHILKLLEERQLGKQEKRKQINRLAEEIRRGKDETKVAQQREELRTLLMQQYQQLSEEIAIRLRIQEQRLEEIRQEHQKRIAEADRRVEEQLVRMTQRRPPPKSANPGKSAVNSEKKTITTPTGKTGETETAKP